MVVKSIFLYIFKKIFYKVYAKFKTKSAKKHIPRTGCLHKFKKSAKKVKKY